MSSKWPAVLARRRGTVGSAISAAMASHDEAFRVTAHDSRYEIQTQAQRKTPILSPDGHWRPSQGPALVPTHRSPPPHGPTATDGRARGRPGGPARRAAGGRRGRVPVG